MRTKNFNNIINQTPTDVRDEVKFSMDVIERLHDLLAKKFNGKQKLLADVLNKSEAEVSKWFNGYQNFTIRTLMLLQKAFGEPIIAVCSDDEQNTTFVQVKCPNNKTTTVHVNADGKMLEKTEFTMLGEIETKRKISTESYS